jgi:hypothetical protein
MGELRENVQIRDRRFFHLFPPWAKARNVSQPGSDPIAAAGVIWIITFSIWMPASVQSRPSATVGQFDSEHALPVTPSRMDLHPIPLPSSGRRVRLVVGAGVRWVRPIQAHVLRQFAP